MFQDRYPNSQSQEILRLSSSVRILVREALEGEHSGLSGLRRLVGEFSKEICSVEEKRQPNRHSEILEIISTEVREVVKRAPELAVLSHTNPLSRAPDVIMELSRKIANLYPEIAHKLNLSAYTLARKNRDLLNEAHALAHLCEMEKDRKTFEAMMGRVLGLELEGEERRQLAPALFKIIAAYTRAHCEGQIQARGIRELTVNLCSKYREECRALFDEAGTILLADPGEAKPLLERYNSPLVIYHAILDVVHLCNDEGLHKEAFGLLRAAERIIKSNDVTDNIFETALLSVIQINQGITIQRWCVGHDAPKFHNEIAKLAQDADNALSDGLLSLDEVSNVDSGCISIPDILEIDTDYWRAQGLYHRALILWGADKGKGIKVVDKAMALIKESDSLDLKVSPRHGRNLYDEIMLAWSDLSKYREELVRKRTFGKGFNFPSKRSPSSSAERGPSDSAFDDNANDGWIEDDEGY